MRVSDGFLDAIDRWRRKQDDDPSRAEAIRRLVELGLSKEITSSKRETAGAATKMIAAAGLEKSAKKSSEMASETIDRLADKLASDDERASRKRRLIKGPAEFREMRRKKPKT